MCEKLLGGEVDHHGGGIPFWLKMNCGGTEERRNGGTYVPRVQIPLWRLQRNCHNGKYTFVRVNGTVAITGRAGGEPGDFHCILYLTVPVIRPIASVPIDCSVPCSSCAPLRTRLRVWESIRRIKLHLQSTKSFGSALVEAFAPIPAAIPRFFVYALSSTQLNSMILIQPFLVLMLDKH